MPNYTVKAGDCISSIADQSGFFWETLWKDAQNNAIKQRRKNPNSLLPGDVVFIPAKRIKEESCAPTRRHVFRVLSVPVKLNLRLLDQEGNPRVDVPYKLDVDGTVKQGTTPADGSISQTIKANAKKAKLTLTPADGPEEQYEFALGCMNPEDDIGGVQGRLKNLGYYRGDVTGSMDEATTNAIRDYQQVAGLPVTGQADDATQAALAQKHGG